MKTLKSLREQNKPIEAPQLDEVAGGGADLPVILIAKRKAIRQFPDGQVVGLYYSKQIDRFITIPHTVIGLSESTVSKKTSAIDDILIKFQAGKIKKAKATQMLKAFGVLNPAPLLREEPEQVDELAAPIRIASTLAKSKVARKAGKLAVGAATQALIKKAQKTNPAQKSNPAKKANDVVDTRKAAKEREAKNNAERVGRKLGLALARKKETNKNNNLLNRESFEIEKLRLIKEDENITTYTLNSGETVDIDYPTAASILEVYDELNQINKMRIIEQLQDIEGFNRIKEFSLER
jgi:hypothetical protein